jgi:predicted amidohydrolase
MHRSVRVAAAQLVAQTIDRAETVWPAVDRSARRAAEQNVELLVFPECTYPAYWLESLQRYRRSDLLNSAAVLERLAATASRYALTLVAGYVEEADGVLYNSAALIDPRGQVLGVCRKSFLWDCDNLWFHAGRTVTSIQTDLGNIGICICADARAPEVIASLANAGAELVALPTAWVNTAHESGVYRSIQVDFLIEARAREFGLPFVCADKSGAEPPHMRYVGQSRIVAAGGRLLAAAPPEGDHLVVAEVSLARPTLRSPDASQLQRLSMSAVLRPKLSNTDRLRIAACTSERDPTDQIASEPSFDLIVSSTRGVLRAPRLAANLDALGVVEMAGSDMNWYASARCASLAGARLLIISDAPDDDAILRVRAAENRVFIAAASRRQALIISPSGDVIARNNSDRPFAAAEIDIAAADDKYITPLTNIWEQRRSDVYRLASICSERPLELIR